MGTERPGTMVCYKPDGTRIAAEPHSPLFSTVTMVATHYIDEHGVELPLKAPEED